MRHTGGCLVVLEGIDGSGKATQARLACRALKRRGYTVRSFDFPRYDSTMAGKLIGECLAGAHGDFARLSPHVASMLYAVDRYEMRDSLREALETGAVVVLDRYVGSNMIHQGGKFDTATERRAFFEWLDELEHRVFGMPRPDLVIYFDLDPSIASERAAQSRKKKSYLGDLSRDAHESNAEHLRRASESARQAARLFKWRRVILNDRLRSLTKEEVHARVMEHLTEALS